MTWKVFVVIEDEPDEAAITAPEFATEEAAAAYALLAEEGAATGGWVDLAMHPELAPFLEEDEEMPAPAELPSFEQMSRDGGFGEFYTIYRMITRRAHPNLDAARSRLSWNRRPVSLHQSLPSSPWSSAIPTSSCASTSLRNSASWWTSDWVGAVQLRSTTYSMT